MGKAARGMLRLTVLLTVMAVAFASASTLGGITAGTLGAGGDSVTSCDSDGVTISYLTAGGDVTGVTVGGLAPACAGGDLSLTLINSSMAAVGGAGPVVVSATSHTLTIPQEPDATLVTGVHVVITGP